MMTTTTNRKATFDKICIFIYVHKDELINEMAKYFYFCSTKYCDLPFKQRTELAEARYKADREKIAERLLNILESDGDWYNEIKEVFGEYVVAHVAGDYADALIKKLNPSAASIAKRKAMLERINNYLSEQSDELIDDMASYLYGYTTIDNYRLPYTERRKLAEDCFKKDAGKVTNRLLSILEEHHGNRQEKIEEIFSKYLTRSDAEDYAKALVEKYDHLR